MGGQKEATAAATEEAKAEEEEVPNNWEYEKAVFFWKLKADTTTEDVKAFLTKIGPLDYCYVATDADGNTKKLGRAKFRPVAAVEDKKLTKDQAILKARARACENA